MNLSPEETDELLDREDITVYPSAYAHFAFMGKYDETPIDTLVRSYYLSNLRLRA